MVNPAEIPQWVILLFGIFLGTLMLRLYPHLINRRFPRLDEKLKIKCPNCGNTNLERWKEEGPTYIEYKCLTCGEIFYPR